MEDEKNNIKKEKLYAKNNDESSENSGERLDTRDDDKIWELEKIENENVSQNINLKKCQNKEEDNENIQNFIEKQNEDNNEIINEKIIFPEDGKDKKLTEIIKVKIVNDKNSYEKMLNIKNENLNDMNLEEKAEEKEEDSEMKLEFKNGKNNKEEKKENFEKIEVKEDLKIKSKSGEKLKAYENLFFSNEVSLNLFGNKKNIFEKISINSFRITIIKKKKQKNKKVNEIKFFIFPKEEEEENNVFSNLSKIKPKGLKNLGSCCYMNATLQCFYHIKEFSNYFLKNRRIIKRKKGLITNGLLDLFEGLSKNNKDTYYEPYLFKNNLIEVEELFDGGGGKDSGDLVETILTSCQDELAGDSDFPDFSIDQREERLMYLDLRNKNLQARSIIMDLFGFETKLTSRCLSCGVQFFNISYENILFFGLEGIYKFKGKYIKNGEDKEIISLYNSKRRLSVEDCLNNFIFDGANRENAICKYCHKTTEILSIRGFASLPEILIMIMSRGHGEKFECHVDFNEELDLKDYYSGIKNMKKEENTKYSILAGTILYGSRGYGHTVAFCKHFDGEYYLFNDSVTRKTSFNEIKNNKIYLLFYQKNK